MYGIPPVPIDGTAVVNASEQGMGYNPYQQLHNGSGYWQTTNAMSAQDPQQMMLLAAGSAASLGRDAAGVSTRRVMTLPGYPQTVAPQQQQGVALAGAMNTNGMQRSFSPPLILPPGQQSQLQQIQQQQQFAINRQGQIMAQGSGSAPVPLAGVNVNKNGNNMIMGYKDQGITAPSLGVQQQQATGVPLLMREDRASTGVGAAAGGVIYRDMQDVFDEMDNTRMMDMHNSNGRRGNARNDRDRDRNNSSGRGNDRNGQQGGRGAASPVRDPLVEDFRSTYGKGRQWELKDLVGHVVPFCQDQHGSRFIQQRLEVASEAEKQIIFNEVIPCAHSLMTDVFGNYVIQKLFEYGMPDQCESLAALLTGHAVPLAMQMYGCRVIQKALEYVSTKRLVILVGEFEGSQVT